MNISTDILFQLVLILKVPVIASLLLLFGVILFETGMFSREWLDRKRVLKAWDGYTAGLYDAGYGPARLRNELAPPGACPAMVNRFVHAACERPDSRPYLEKVYADLEVEAGRRCRLVRIGVRLGPVLGLMGTLIPMGPALMSISNGDMETMAHNLVVAFSTTVVGLVIGSLSLVMLVMRQHWYASDLAAIDAIYQAVFLAKGENACAT